MASHGLVGDRPLVVGSVSPPSVASGWCVELERVVDTALTCGAAGTLGPRRTTLDAADTSELARINRRTISDVRLDWPSISVVINAYNAAATIDECLSHCDALTYPELEVIVVDDGSSDATPSIVAAHPRARLIRIPHRGLAEGRNVGFRAAHSDLVAYLDADAYPSSDWPWYLALAAVGERVGGSGGPNVPPPDEPLSARAVARSPGGPVPQLLRPDRAAHVPGCNMAFWRSVLERLGGFDPVIEGAEDIELEWRAIDSGHEIAYHPAALVWHHRRPGLGAYLRQQRLYGRGQAILERRYPERFPRGRRMRTLTARLRRGRQPAHHGGIQMTRYLSLPPAESQHLTLAHQWGMPVAAVLVCTAPLALVRRALAAPAVAAAGFVATLFAADVVTSGSGADRSRRTVTFRTRIAAFRLLRPLAFRWGHVMGRREARSAAAGWPPAPAAMAAPGSPSRAAARDPSLTRGDQHAPRRLSTAGMVFRRIRRSSRTDQRSR
jgi:GT2 family glycosyltransferase